MKISIFSSATNPNPTGSIEVERFYLDVIEGKYRDLVNKIRSGNLEMKKHIPAVTMSGLFEYRSSDRLIEHSGRICIDLDGKLNPGVESWTDLRDTIGTWEEVEFCSLSVSGNGVFCVILVAYPNRHLEHWLSLEKDFKLNGLNIDPPTKDVARLRFASYDPDAIYNKDVKKYRGIFVRPKPEPCFIGDSGSERIIKKIIEERVNVAESYDDWFRLGCALANEFGESGRGYFHSISSFSAKYCQRECDRKYDDCLKTNGKVTAGTLYYLYQSNKI